MCIVYVVWAINSAGECYLHTVEVTGSNPVSPTIRLLPPHIMMLTRSVRLALRSCRNNFVQNNYL